MNRQIRLVIGWLTLLGAAFGVVIVAAMLARSGALPISAALAPACMIGYFAFGVYAAIATIRQKGRWAVWILVFWLAQLPLVSSASFSYISSTAVGVWLFVSSELRVGTNFYLGSYLGLTVGSAGNLSLFGPDTVVGINLVAVAVLFAILRGLRSRVT